MSVSLCLCVPLCVSVSQVPKSRVCVCLCLSVCLRESVCVFKRESVYVLRTCVSMHFDVLCACMCARERV